MPRITNNTNVTHEEEGKVIYPKLSYQLMGILFEVHNKLGTKYLEKHYQNAVEIKLKDLGVPYKREEKVDIKFEKGDLGEFYVDFIIDDKVVLELKKVWRITRNDIKQVLRYLEATGLKLAIIANFKYERLQYRRVIK